MKRPYVICHILSSLDGKINGPFMGTGSAAGLAGTYAALRSGMNADAWLYGTATTKEFTDHVRPVLEDGSSVPDGDFVADDQAELYYVSVDTEGEIGWESGTFANRGRTPAHVIEVLTVSTSASYKAYLRKRGVSYILAGRDSLDCRLAAEKLYRLFHIKKLLICGGGVVNWSFLQAGVIDELSLLLAPVTDGSRGSASLFTQLSSLNEGSPVEFTLKTVEKAGDNGVYLNYLAENAENGQ